MVDSESLTRQEAKLNVSPESREHMSDSSRIRMRKITLSHTAEIADALGNQPASDEKPTTEVSEAEVKVEVAPEDLDMSEISDRLSAVVGLDEKDAELLGLYLQENPEEGDSTLDYSDYVKIVQKIIDAYVDATGGEFDGFKKLENNADRKQLALLRQCAGVSIDTKTGDLRRVKGQSVSAIISEFYSNEIKARVLLDAKIVFSSLTIFLEDSAKPDKKGL